MDSDSHDSHAHDTRYVKIWAVLLGLLIVSVAGPFLGVRAVTLVTAFGIAGVKAWMVAAHFMHLKTERRYVSYLILTMVAFMLLLFAGTSPDVMKHDGQRWRNDAAHAEVQRVMGAAHP